MVIVMKESQYVVDEEDGVVQVCVEIESGSLDGVVATVSLNTEDDSALQSGEALNLLHATYCVTVTMWSVTVLPRCILKNIVLARRMSLATYSFLTKFHVGVFVFLMQALVYPTVCSPFHSHLTHSKDLMLFCTQLYCFFSVQYNSYLRFSYYCSGL